MEGSDIDNFEETSTCESALRYAREKGMGGEMTLAPGIS
jgi:hypothetical protein